MATPRAGEGLERGETLRVQGLDVDYVTEEGVVAAVRDMAFSLRAGEIVGIAGESGCGKSTLAHAVCGLLRPPARIRRGRVELGGQDLVGLSERAMRSIRWERIAIVPQSAMNNLSPVLRVGDQIADAMLAHRPGTRAEAREKARGLLQMVGMSRRHVASYPHELSGGMRQRAVIAMALALNPEVLVLDEPTTALDVIVQAAILGTIRDLRDQFGFAVLLITHDLPLLLQTVDRILVMYGGGLVESGSADGIWRRPRHPYTRALLGAFPPLTGPRARLEAIRGMPPNLLRPPAGCAFAPRCPLAGEACRRQRPPLAVQGDAAAACWRWEAGEGEG